MIYEITGQPGHGKSLYGLMLARNFAKAGRTVFAHGVRDLSYTKTGFLELTDPAKWEELPDNSVVLIDECYTVFPNRNAASAVPRYIEALARHRHRGFDFILIHQQPNQVDPFVRGLVDTHHHIRRKFGFQGAVIKTWDYSSANPIKDPPLRAPSWRYDKSIYELYTSATMHTVKRTMPWQLYIVLPILAFVCWTGYRLLSGETLNPGIGDAAAGAPASAGVPAVSGVFAQGSIETPEQWAARFVPRIPAHPKSAPAWDGREAVSDYRIACMIGERVGCLCLTEQGTRYEMNQFECVALVESGGAYDPFKAEQGGGSGRSASASPDDGGPLKAAGVIK